ncbi:hypothetical protein LQ938_09730 [Microbacterium sp. cx-55]|uniref:phage tail protein n=1 Tax=Microbacterium sp. cx-55 TaxID=2875948 RepID=UPI001CC08D46|nr:hypothetical protein [Microbacterium sp. cx-55]MBZ4485959.1 hypothetical protein [Microbacterium sp. cx-55]UGB34167.1 hypothetical protein LQ938_09730 [Microbacterium sp. cx-55]
MAGQAIAISVLADTAPFSKAMKNVGVGVGVALAAVAAGVVALGVEAFKAVAEVERLNAQTSAALQSTGGAAQRSLEQITGLADSLERMSGVEAEVISGAQNMLLTFTNIKGDNFDAATKAALDMSVAMGTDMTSAATLVGKALNDPVKGIGALSKVGVQLTAEQKAMVEQFTAVGDAAGAQGVILGVLAEQFGGSAEAFGGTFLGTVEKVKNSFGAVTEALVAGLLPSATSVLSKVNELFLAIGNSPVFAAIIENINGFVSALFAGEGPIADFVGQALTLATSISPLGIVFAALAPLLPQLAALFTTLAASLGGALAEILPTIVNLAHTLATTLGGVLAAVLPVIATLLTTLAGVFATLLPVIAPIVQMLAGNLNAAISELAPVIGVVVTALGGALGSVLQALSPVLVLVATVFGELVKAVMPIVGAVMPLVAALLTLIEPIAQLIGAILPPVIDLFMTLLSPILALIAPLVQLLTPAIELVAGVLGVVVGAIATAITWLVDLVTGSKKGAAGFTKPFEAVGGFFKGVIDNVFGFFNDLPNRIGTLFAGAGSWLINAGRDIINGLVKGAGQLLPQIGKFFLDMVPDWIVGPFKAALGIHSPSRVFQQLGSFTVQGLAVGLGQLSPVERAMDALSGAVSGNYTPLAGVGAPTVRSDARGALTAPKAATAAAPGMVELSPFDRQLLVDIRNSIGITIAERSLQSVVNGGNSNASQRRAG